MSRPNHLGHVQESLRGLLSSYVSALEIKDRGVHYNWFLKGVTNLGKTIFIVIGYGSKEPRGNSL